MKGITPVVAVILLLLMTIVVAGVFYFWMTGIQARIQQAIGGQIEKEMARAAYMIKIAGLECNSAGGSIKLFLQNVGADPIPPGTYAVSASDVGGRSVGVNNTEVATTFGVNTIITLGPLTGYTLIANQTYTVRVVAPGGAEATDTCVAK